MKPNNKTGGGRINFNFYKGEVLKYLTIIISIVIFLQLELIKVLETIKQKLYI